MGLALAARMLVVAVALTGSQVALCASGDTAGGDRAIGDAAGSPGSVAQASTLLSRYPVGLVPIEPAVIGAIDLLGRYGSRAEVPVLRSLVEHERDEVARAAGTAIAAIRERQRDDQRAAFAAALPDWPELARGAVPLRAAGLGREEAVCAAYATFVLGDPLVATSVVGRGRPADRLAEGSPREALATVSDDLSGAIVAATAREDLGDVPGAVRIWSTLAARGVPEARAALDGYGVDVERLLLGMMVSDPTVSAPVETRVRMVGGGTPGDNDAGLLELLVRHGGSLTVVVLAERTRHTTASEGATAADALARMLDPTMRGEPLPLGVEGEARRALHQASLHGPAPVALIATEALDR